MSLFFYKCPLKFTTGISCPGCGMTRAFGALLKLDFEMAFYYHPLWPLAVLSIVLVIINLIKPFKVKEKTKLFFIILVCVVFIVVYIIRIIIKDPVVLPVFKESLIYYVYKLF